MNPDTQISTKEYLIDSLVCLSLCYLTF